MGTTESLAAAHLEFWTASASEASRGAPASLFQRFSRWAIAIEIGPLYVPGVLAFFDHSSFGIFFWNERRRKTIDICTSLYFEYCSGINFGYVSEGIVKTRILKLSLWRM